MFLSNAVTFFYNKFLFALKKIKYLCIGLIYKNDSFLLRLEALKVRLKKFIVRKFI